MLNIPKDLFVHISNSDQLLHSCCSCLCMQVIQFRAY